MTDERYFSVLVRDTPPDGLAMAVAYWPPVYNDNLKLTAGAHRVNTALSLGSSISRCAAWFKVHWKEAMLIVIYKRAGAREYRLDLVHEQVVPAPDPGWQFLASATTADGAVEILRSYLDLETSN